MTIDVYTSTGTKKGTATLPKTLFEAPVNEVLMHQALMMQQSNRRRPIAHVKSRGEVKGSTRKLFAQKGTGRARRGSIRSPLLRGGGKAFGPRSTASFTKKMPKNMRRNALFSCLSLQAKNNGIIGLEAYTETIKTKQAHQLMAKLPIDIGRKVVFVTADRNEALAKSVSNIPGAKVITAAYLNPEDILGAHKLVFLVDAIKKAEEVFGRVKVAVAQTSTEKSVAGVKSVVGAKKQRSPTTSPTPKKPNKPSASKKVTTKKSPSTKSFPKKS